MRALADRLVALLASGRRGALATVIATRGSTPARVGAKLLLDEDGGVTGTVGGGRFEHVILDECREVMAAGVARTVERHLAHDLGMCCGGAMSVFIEPVEAPPELVLFGAGHVAKATAELAARVGFSVSVVDAREAWNDAARFPEAKRVLMDPAEAIAKRAVVLGANSYVVITTHDHGLDEEALRAAAPHPHRYLGMIGSKRKVVRTFQRVLQRDPDARLDDVHAPIGLDLGGVTPEEIGLAIVAELVATRRGRTGASLRLVEVAGHTGATADGAAPEWTRNEA